MHRRGFLRVLPALGGAAALSLIGNGDDARVSRLEFTDEHGEVTHCMQVQDGRLYIGSIENDGAVDVAGSVVITHCFLTNASVVTKVAP